MVTELVRTAMRSSLTSHVYGIVPVSFTAVKKRGEKTYTVKCL